MRKRLIAISIVLLFGCFTGWLIIEASGPEILPVGSVMPEITYTSKIGSNVLRADSTRETMVIFFNSGCMHCKYELSELNKNIEKFKNTKIYLFTLEKDFFSKPVVKDWSGLYGAKNVQLGIVDDNNYKNKFGSMVTPSIFIFGHSGRLVKKILGEMKIENLLKDLKL